jgi:uncharacterized protein
MVKRKSTGKRSTGAKAKKKRTAGKAFAGGNVLKIFAAVAILLAFVVFAAVTARFMVAPQGPPLAVKKPVVKTGPAQSKQPGPAPVAEPPLPYEIYPARDLPGDRTALSVKKRPRPAVSIIIDDMGYKKALAEEFCRLGAALTFSVIPLSPYKTSIIKSASDHGIEIMLHLPMEPNEFPRVDPGPGALFSSMTPDELIAQLNQDLDDVPLAKGVNNHMGSKLTSSSFQMNQIFSILKKRGLFFIDSRTTAETVAWQSARLLQVPFTQRDVFLDNVQERASVKKQILTLIKTARQHGGAVGIGHPYAITLDVLEEMLPEIKKQVDILPASQMVHLIPYS